MSQAFALYEQKKQNVLTQITLLKEMAKELEHQIAVQECDELIELLKREQFEIMVAGEFSNGKSTFVNALLGHDVLPSGVQPTTAVLNKISYNQVPEYRLKFRDSKRAPAELTAEAFRNIVAPDELPDEGALAKEALKKKLTLIQQIEHTEIGYPAEVCKHDVVIIDSPGTNDLDPGRETITNYYIPKSDAVIIVFHVLKALSDSEMSFIKYRILASDIQKVFFVVNFKDMTSESELEKVCSYVTEKLSEVVKAPKVFAVSSRHALLNRSPQLIVANRRSRKPLLPLEQTGILEFEQALLSFLEYERGAIKLAKPAHRAIKTAEAMLERYVTFERATMNHNIRDLKQQQQAFYERIEKARMQGKESVRRFELMLQQQEIELRHWYEKQLAGISAQAKKSLQAHYYKGCNVETVKQKIEEDIAPLETELGQRLQEKARQMLNDGIAEESQELLEQLQGIKSEWSSLLPSDLIIRSLVHLDVADFIFMPLVLAGGIIGGAIELISGIFTAIGDFFTGRDSKLEQLERDISQRFDAPIKQRCQKLREQWNIIVPDIKEKYEANIHHMVEDTRLQMEAMIRNSRLTEQETREMMKRLEVRESRLVHIVQELLNNQIITEESAAYAE